MLRRNFFSFLGIPAFSFFPEHKAEEPKQVIKLKGQVITILKEGMHLLDKDGTQFWYNHEGQLHRENDLPAVIYDNLKATWNKSIKKKWYQNDEMYRANDLPTSTWELTYSTKVLIGESNDYGLYEESDYKQVAVIERTEEWHNKRGLHRENDLPATIHYINDVVASESWYLNGVLIKYRSLLRSNGEIQIAYQLNGKY